MKEFIQRLLGSRYVGLEGEVARLRAENRALTNSLLGTAGFPPVDFPAAPRRDCAGGRQLHAAGPDANRVIRRQLCAAIPGGGFAWHQRERKSPSGCPSRLRASWRYQTQHDRALLERIASGRALLAHPPRQ